jgi:MscS family membrane protein
MDFANILTSLISEKWFINLIIGIAIFLVIYYLARFIKNYIFGFLKHIAEQTETDLDDIILESLEKPVVYGIKLLGFYMSSYYILTNLNLDPTGNTLNTIKNICFTITIILITNLLVKFLKLFIEGYLNFVAKKAKTNLNENLIKFIGNIISIFLYSISLMIILGIWGIEITPLITSLGIAGLAISLALKDILANVFSGVAIMVDGGIKVGDRIKIKNLDGFVENIGLRSTKLRLLDNNLVTIPNSELANSEIINYNKPTKEYKVVLDVGISYDSDVEKAKKVIEKIIKKVEGLNEKKGIGIYLTEMADYYLNLKIIYYVKSWEFAFRSKDFVYSEILKEFEKQGIDIPFPTYDINLKKQK